MGSAERDGTPVEAGERWAFDAEVVRVFDDMLERSIPQHETMRRAVLDVADRFALAGTTVVDLGAARGEATARLLARRGAGLRYVLVESSAPMAEVLRSRFAGEVEAGVVEVLELDLRTASPFAAGRLERRLEAARLRTDDVGRQLARRLAVESAATGRRVSVVLSVLTLQFIPIEHRQRIVARAAAALAPGGALVLVEKVLGATSDLDELMVERYLAKKQESGYSAEEVDRKRHSLEGVLVPITAAWNEDLLRQAGFRAVDCFWRWMNFAAWVAVR